MTAAKARLDGLGAAGIVEVAQPVLVQLTGQSQVHSLALGLAALYEDPVGLLLCQGPSRCHPCPQPLTCTLGLMSPANTPGVHPVPLSVSLTKIPTSTGPSTDLGRTALLTGFHLATDHNPLDVAISAIPHPSNSPRTKPSSPDSLQSPGEVSAATDMP